MNMIQKSVEKTIREKDEKRDLDLTRYAEYIVVAIESGQEDQLNDKKNNR